MTVVPIEAIGYLAAFLSTVAYFPQLVRMMRTKSVKDISVASYGCLISGSSLWLAYGILLERWPLILSNMIALGFMVAVLGLRARFLRLPDGPGQALTPTHQQFVRGPLCEFPDQSLDDQ